MIEALQTITDVEMDFCDNNPGVALIATEVSGETYYILGRTENNVVVFHYGNPEFSCTFNNLSEVGEGYASWFSKKLHQHQLHVRYHIESGVQLLHKIEGT